MDIIKKALTNITVQIVFIVLISRICIFFFGIWGHQIFPEYHHIQNQGSDFGTEVLSINKDDSLRSIFGKFDSGFYLSISNTGYDITDNSDQNKKVWNFMPLYPIVSRVLSGFSTDLDTIFIVGIVLSNFLFLVSCLLIKVLLEKLKKDKYIIKTVLLICFFPGSIYFSFFYTEALFLFLSVVAAICFLNKRWIVAACVIGLLGVTRKTGLFFLLPFIIAFFRQNSIREKGNLLKAFLLVVLQVLPFIFYILYLGEVSKDISSVYSIQSLWTRVPVFPFSGVYHMLIDPRFTTIFQVGICFIGGYIIFKSRRFLSIEYLLYCALSIVAFLSTGEVASIIRYIAVLFPIYFCLAELVKSRIIFELILVLFSIMQTFLLILYVSGFSFAT